MDISSTLVPPADPSSSHISHSMAYDLSNNIWTLRDGQLHPILF